MGKRTYIYLRFITCASTEATCYPADKSWFDRVNTSEVLKTYLQPLIHTLFVTRMNKELSHCIHRQLRLPQPSLPVFFSERLPFPALILLCCQLSLIFGDSECSHQDPCWCWNTWVWSQFLSPDITLLFYISGPLTHHSGGPENSSICMNSGYFSGDDIHVSEHWLP